MDKRFQVFVSSTYVDLMEERQHVIQTLMEMDCIPAGMEIFPAADEEQWAFIKKVIDDCDYYLLIIGGRYGSVAEDGISYTEKEFDYAVEKGIKVVALVHEAPESIPMGKSEQDPELVEKLSNFKEKVKTGRMVKQWSETKDLPGLVSLSLTKAIKMYPAIGWIRADNINSGELLLEINNLRKENERLASIVDSFDSEPDYKVNDIAGIYEMVTVKGCYSANINGIVKDNLEFERTICWKDLFGLISPFLMNRPSELTVKKIMSESLLEFDKNNLHRNANNAAIDNQEFKSILIQLSAHGLIAAERVKLGPGKLRMTWRLTKAGEKLMYETRVMRKT